MQKIMNSLLVVAVFLVLTGCLSTTKRAFNEANSVLAGQSPAFMQFVERWEAAYGEQSSPRDFVENARRVVELDGQVVVEETANPDDPWYFSSGTFGSRPVLCWPHDDGIEAIAERHGVTVDIKRRDTDAPEKIVQMTADGSEPALYAFIIDVFSNGLLICAVPGPGGLK